MATPSDPIRKLVRLVVLAQETSAEIGPFLKENVAAVAAVLGVDEPLTLALAHLDDRSLVPLLENRLEQYLDRGRKVWRQKKEERASEAARLLGAHAVWTEHGAFLDLGLLFGDVLSTTAKLVVFSAISFEVALPRRKLLAVRAALAHRTDVVMFVDSRGVHFRWKAGRGQLNFLPVTLPKGEMSLLVVALGPTPSPAAATARPPSRCETRAAAG